uniref:Uncharacterized protein n=1 Tax=Siphoviridae sp. ct6HQ3 TaxID=2825341 RepID=A0A8S5VAA0_9CAUD|nr:MAG TPA: hypothetical protein [Siphoviridae sp. ct6HQ3]
METSCITAKIAVMQVHGCSVLGVLDGRLVAQP